MKNIHLEEAAQRMEKSVELFHSQTVYLGYNNLNAIGQLKVNHYPIDQVASITAPHPGKVIIKPFDESLLTDIVRVIQTANLGISVFQEGKCVAATMPLMSSEQREQLCKHVAHMGEEAKVAIRNIRKDTRKHLEKAELPEDDLHKAFDKLQALTDDYVYHVDVMIKGKQAKLME